MSPVLQKAGSNLEIKYSSGVATMRSHLVLAIVAAVGLILPSAGALNLDRDGEEEWAAGKLLSLSRGATGVIRLRGGFFSKKKSARDYEFDAEDEAAFKTAGGLMRGISRGFFFHSIVEALMFLREAFDGNGHYLMLVECLDELAYANLIRSAASCMDDIILTQGNDIKHLMSSVEMQNKMWQKMRIALYIKTTLLIAELAKRLFGERIWGLIRGPATRVGRDLDATFGPAVRSVTSALSSGINGIVGLIAGIWESFSNSLSGLARAADKSWAVLSGRMTDLGIVCERRMDGSVIVGSLTRPVAVKDLQSMKGGWDPMTVQVGDTILSVGDDFTSGKLPAFVESQLMGPMGSSIRVRMMRALPGGGVGQYFATLVRQV